jgi:phage gp36-like protein
MAHPYTTATILNEATGTDLVNQLGDFENDDDLADTNVISSAIERADNEIDTRLGKRFVVPFAAQAATPGIIEDISTHLALYQLISQRHAGSAEANFHREQANELIEGLLSGEFYLNAAEVTGDEAAIGLAQDAGENVFQGRDEVDVDRMESW